MSQKLITATVAPAVKEELKELSVDDRVKSTEWRFALAYVANGFNATAAAKEVFKPGKRGGKDIEHSAQQMGWRMLSSVEVRKYITEIAITENFLPAKAMKRLAYLMENATSQDMQANISWRILENAGIVKGQEQVQDHRHLHLVLPQRKDIPPIKDVPTSS